jgi:DNA invertase Pin-like site-specific DNA recombinase
MLGIYCRISQKKDEGKDRSIDDQKLLGIEKAKELGMGYELFIDEGITATSDNPEDRPEFMRMLSRMTEGIIKAVFAFDQSRLERNPKVRFMILEHFKEHDIKCYTHVEGLVDIHNPQVEFFGDILSIINKYQVTMTKIKVASVLKRRVSEGKAHGILKYGYTKDENGFLIICEEEAVIVKLIYELSLGGMGVGSIAFFLNEKSIPTRYNKIGKGTYSMKNKYTGKISTRNKSEVKWAAKTVRDILTGTIYYGKRNWGNIILPSPIIIEEPYWHMVQDNFKNNSNTRGKKVVHFYLLKGLIRCGVCGRNMYGRTRVSKKDNFYMCSSKRIKNESCINRSINIYRLDDFIWNILFGKENFIQRLEEEIVDEGGKKEKFLNDISEERKRLEELKKEKFNSISLQVKGIISESDLTTTLKSIEADIKASEQKVKAMEFSEYTLIRDREKIHEIKDKFKKYTQITHPTQKINAIHDFIKNIIVKCVDNKHYEIEVEYKLGLKTDTWLTSNLQAKYFFREFEGHNGWKRLQIHSPRPISDPNDNSGWKDLFKVDSKKEIQINLPRLIDGKGNDITNEKLP